ncbi:hypothetical protein PUNSTDRAFT_154760 [Punctularia strigosozonata HHB-11173 SS5]|uniref:uncharacterized protein n=1 Tax=Punctularia strigosozonata (strain HHB-11173) TaxID=741275 RepID=UPI0004417806|nr:uncharacterized protein PUNSTDRAFT_154760 [Punctularia strigosozonata HHB-11173 SS5]EIN14754.1 hypothetical protein PUNSTDRAFT_154760 [Punctularia strigosozonata HHB-11173 SS5]
MLALLALAHLLVACAFARGTLPKGFVTTDGNRFLLDGKPFAFVGTNSYWLPLLTSDADVEKTLNDMQAAGVKVLCTWGFNAITGSELAGAKQSDLTYYQVWNSSKWVLNDGPQGLQCLDHVIEAAGKHNIKVILAFTNNWVGYGGAELYINWIAGSNATHNVFYTDPKIISSYSSPSIFAWELMNEAQCAGDLPASSAVARKKCKSLYK